MEVISSTPATVVVEYDSAEEFEMHLKAQAVQPKLKLRPIVNEGQTIGRNDKCPCDSGRKFKKCCLWRMMPGRLSGEVEATK